LDTLGRDIVSELMGMAAWYNAPRARGPAPGGGGGGGGALGAQPLPRVLERAPTPPLTMQACSPTRFRLWWASASRRAT
jgi:hypothetical protein